MGENQNNNEPVNIAVFRYRQVNQPSKDLKATVSSTISADESIRTFFDEVIPAIKKNSESDIELLEIYSEWKPSAKIMSRIEREYPNVVFTYLFEEGNEEKFRAEMEKIKNPSKKKWWQFWK